LTPKLVCILILLFLIEPGFSQVPGISSSNLPLVVINTNGQSIQDVAKIAANMKIIFNGSGKLNTPSDPGNVYNGNVGIEIHGAYSATFPQKSYGIESKDKAGNKLNVSLLGMPEENDWILLANYNDKTFMRNMLAFEISRRLGHYAPRTQLVEVILNNEYRGIYILTEKIKRDKGRVNIAKLIITTIQTVGKVIVLQSIILQNRYTMFLKTQRLMILFTNRRIISNLQSVRLRESCTLRILQIKAPVIRHGST
jgi:hypothetical protein